jgi:DNA-directed RNA polymerase subunit beta
VDIVLNPLGVPSRMNVGQVLETHWAGRRSCSAPVCHARVRWHFEKQIRNYLKEAELPENGKTRLYDGRTGELFDQEIVVGYIYMMKLGHLVG